MSRVGRLVAAVALAALGPRGLAAQTEGSVVARLAGSTRAQALGDASVALTGDPGVLFANPAGIATIRGWSLEGSFESYLEGASYAAGAFAMRSGRFTVGLGVQSLNFGTEPEIVPDPATGGRRGMATGAEFSAADLLAVTTLVYRFSLFALGGSAKYARQSVGGWAAGGWVGDLGIAVAVFDIAALGFAVQNIGPDLDRAAELPIRTRAGITFNFTDPLGSVRALTSIERRWTQHEAAVLLLGVEAGVLRDGRGLVGRIGYRSGGDASDESRLSVGGGLVFGSVRLDYAYRDFDLLGTGTHRFGLRWKP
jgi:hypothetical protein